MDGQDLRGPRETSGCSGAACGPGSPHKVADPWVQCLWGKILRRRSYQGESVKSPAAPDEEARVGFTGSASNPYLIYATHGRPLCADGTLA